MTDTPKPTHDVRGQMLPRTRLARLLALSDGWLDPDEQTIPAGRGYGQPLELTRGPRGILIAPETTWPAWYHYDALAGAIVDAHKVDEAISNAALVKLATKDAA